jgi:hypothetical protein
MSMKIWGQVLQFSVLRGGKEEGGGVKINRALSLFYKFLLTSWYVSYNRHKCKNNKNCFVFDTEER